MLKKISLTLLYAAVAFAIYLFGDNIMSWLQHSTNIPAIIFVAIMMALFPIIPYPIVGGVIGAALGPVSGAVITWIGSTAASILMFTFVRYGYQDWGGRMLHRYQKIGKLTTLFERNAFLAVLFARLIPFIPSIIVNVYAALSRMSFLSYTVASSIGKIPAMLLFVVVGNNAVTHPQSILKTVLIYGLFLAASWAVYRWWRRRSAERIA